jgi:hypothetical protein
MTCQRTGARDTCLCLQHALSRCQPCLRYKKALAAAWWDSRQEACGESGVGGAAERQRRRRRRRRRWQHLLGSFSQCCDMLYLSSCIGGGRRSCSVYGLRGRYGVGCGGVGGGCACC